MRGQRMRILADIGAYHMLLTARAPAATAVGDRDVREPHGLLFSAGIG